MIVVTTVVFPVIFIQYVSSMNFLYFCGYRTSTPTIGYYEPAMVKRTMSKPLKVDYRMKIEESYQHSYCLSHPHLKLKIFKNDSTVSHLTGYCY